MFKFEKGNKMAITVKGVDVANDDRRILMSYIIRRNCDVDYRIIDSMINKGRCYGEKGHEKCDYDLELENFDFAGISRDFKLLQLAGVIEHVVKATNYIVY